MGIGRESVLGESTFSSLLWFLGEHAPDPLSRQVVRPAAQVQAGHVAFNLAHLQRPAARDHTVHARLTAAEQYRHAALHDTAGLNAQVFDALVLLPAGSLEPKAIARGFEGVVQLEQNMHYGRELRLRKLGFSDAQAEELTPLPTRSFM